MSGFVMKNFLDCHLKQPRDAEGKGEGRIVLAGFDGVDGLPLHIEMHREIGLAPVALGTEDFEAVFHGFAPPRHRLAAKATWKTKATSERPKVTSIAAKSSNVLKTGNTPSIISNPAAPSAQRDAVHK